MHEITELFAYVVTDCDGDEGILRYDASGGAMIATSRQRLEHFTDLAIRTAAMLEQPLSIAHFVRMKGGK